LAFVQKGVSSTMEHLRRLARDHEAQAEGQRFLVVVVEGATADEAEALRTQLHLDFLVLGDANGALARRAGARFSPTTLTLDERGIVTKFEVGLDATNHDTGAVAEAE
jgi:hypothetical protein